MFLCRWWLFPSRCATLSFSRALCGLFNRVINFWFCVFSLHYLPCGSAWLHRWTDCSTQGDAFRNFQLPVLESEHWHWCVRFRPNGLHFLSLALQWCWNQPLSRKVVVVAVVAVVGGDGWWLVTEVETRVNLMSKAWRFIHDSSMTCRWGEIFTFCNMKEVKLTFTNLFQDWAFQEKICWVASDASTSFQASLQDRTIVQMWIYL